MNDHLFDSGSDQSSPHIEITRTGMLFIEGKDVTQWELSRMEVDSLMRKLAKVSPKALKRPKRRCRK